MMLKSKMTAAGMAVAIILMIGYVFYALSDAAPAADDMKGWAWLILVFIGISVIAQVITQVAVHVLFAVSMAVKEEADDRSIKRIMRSEMREDEMDERITMRSSHTGFGFVGVGFVFVLIALAFFDITVGLLLNILLGIFFIAMILGAFEGMFLYEKGDKGMICRMREDE